MNTARLESLLEAVLLKLDQLSAAPQPHLKVSEFAAKTGLSRWTVKRKMAQGIIRTEKGRIPAAELQKFTS